MRTAGAILLGKTNIYDGKPAYERPNNPYHLSRTPGGSSSGEAAIIAAGGSPVGLGSDSGGSIRYPAHCCGVAGLKPTNGRIPNTGHFPRISAMSDPRTQIGPLARHVEDLALVLPVIAGPDGRDASVIPMPLGSPAEVDVASLRVAWYVEDGVASPTEDVVGAVRAAVAALESAGCAVEEALPPRLDESPELTKVYWSRTRSTAWASWQSDGKTTLSGEDVDRSLFEWDRFRRAMLGFMQDYDLIVSPAAPSAAGPHAPLDIDNFLYTLPYSLTGYPVVVIRAGTSPEGLPVGVQVVARSWEDQIALAAAAAIEHVLGPWPPPHIGHPLT
jgi:amidase